MSTALVQFTDASLLWNLMDIFPSNLPWPSPLWCCRPPGTPLGWSRGRQVEEAAPGDVEGDSQRWDLQRTRVLGGRKDSVTEHTSPLQSAHTCKKYELAPCCNKEKPRLLFSSFSSSLKFTHSSKDKMIVSRQHAKIRAAFFGFLVSLSSRLCVN